MTGDKTIMISAALCFLLGSCTLNEENVNAKSIQKAMGHARADTTMNIYVHENDEHQKSEMKKYYEAI